MEYQTPDFHNSGYGPGPWWNPDPDYEKRVVKETRTCFSRVGLIYTIFIIVANGSQWLAAVFLAESGLMTRISWNQYMLMSLFSMYPVAVPLTWLLMKTVPAKGRPVRESWRLGKLAGFFVFCMGALYVGNFVGRVLMLFAGLIKGEPILNDMEGLITSMEPWMILVSAVIAAPVMEELVFRKFLLDRIAGYGHWTAMMVSGVLFGIVHGNFYQFFYAFFLGVVFAYVYLHTGKIRYTIGFHMLINFMGSILPLELLKIVQKNALIGGILSTGNLMLMIGFIICGVILLAYYWRDLSFPPAMDGISTKKRIGSVWLNVGMIAFLACGLILFAMSL